MNLGLPLQNVTSIATKCKIGHGILMDFCPPKLSSMICTRLRRIPFYRPGQGPQKFKAEKRPFNLNLDFWKSRSWEIKVCFKPYKNFRSCSPGFFFSLSPGFFQVYGIKLKKNSGDKLKKKSGVLKKNSVLQDLKFF